jgi:hypothetical protein
MTRATPSHLPEYLMEAFGLALFMVSSGPPSSVTPTPPCTGRSRTRSPGGRSWAWRWA